MYLIVALKTRIMLKKIIISYSKNIEVVEECERKEKRE
jgi:hypothetical protein